MNAADDNGVAPCGVLFSLIWYEFLPHRCAIGCDRDKTQMGI